MAQEGRGEPLRARGKVPPRHHVPRGEGSAAGPRRGGEAVPQRRGLRLPGGGLALGEMHERGEGVPPDPGEAVQYYRDASWWGSAEAMFRLGKMYRDGRGAEQDLRRAGKLFDDAAKLGHKGAAEALSRMPGEDGGARTAQ